MVKLKLKMKLIFNYFIRFDKAMPYKIVRYKYGFRVCKADKPSECYSNKPLTKTRAKAQQTAIVLSEMGLSKPRKT